MGDKLIWDDARVARLRKLVAEGVSNAEIGRYFGCGRERIGQIKHQLGITRTNLWDRKGVTTLGFVPGTAPVDREKAMRTLMTLSERNADAFRRWEPGQGVSILDLARTGQCRWPLGTLAQSSGHVCGEDSGEATYCIAHSRLAYVKE